MKQSVVCAESVRVTGRFLFFLFFFYLFFLFFFFFFSVLRQGVCRFSRHFARLSFFFCVTVVAMQRRRTLRGPIEYADVPLNVPRRNTGFSPLRRRVPPRPRPQIRTVLLSLSSVWSKRHLRLRSLPTFG